MRRISAFLIAAALFCAPAAAQQINSSGSPATTTLGTASIGTLQASTAAIGGATIGSNALAVTGIAQFNTGIVIASPGGAAGYDITLINTHGIKWGGRTEIFADANGELTLYNNAESAVLRLTWPATGTLQQGAADAAVAVAQTTRVQSVVAGTSNTAGADWSFYGSAGTGLGAGGAVKMYTSPAGGSGTSQNAGVLVLTLNPTLGGALTTTNVSANNLSLASLPTDAGSTDNTVCVNAGGSLLKGSGVAGICLGTSSARYKQDIRPLEAGLKQVLAIKPVAFRYLPEYGTADRDLYGFTAEDVHPIMPKLVSLDARGRPNSVDWAGMVPVLAKAIQEQQAQIEDLKARAGVPYVPPHYRPWAMAR